MALKMALLHRGSKLSKLHTLELEGMPRLSEAEVKKLRTMRKDLSIRSDLKKN